ncbi:MAG TPA: sugar ABC transporter substrate-binding protein [Clostridiaceae bacterium]|nr:sugar ABC transporter substrate-binding protein [Clostridiaceae bacterium]
MAKKVLAILLLMFFVLSMAVGCAQKETNQPANQTSKTDETSKADETAKTDGAEQTSGKKIKIGYVCNFMNAEWYQNVIKGAKHKAAQLGVDIDVADANNDSAQQVSFAENLMAQGIDVLALTPVDAKTLKPVIESAKAKGIAVVTESNPVGGEATTVGADNKAAGKMAGLWMGEYAKKNNMELKLLIVGFPNFEDCRLRVEGFKEGLEETGAKYTIKQEVDSQGLKEKALAVSTDALTANPDINAIFGINDDSTQGAIQAYKSSGLDMSKLVAVGFGLEGSVGREALLNNTPIKAELAMFPEYVGALLVESCVKAYNGEKLPERLVTPTTMITPDTYKDFYKQEGNDWMLDFSAVEAIK